MTRKRTFTWLAVFSLLIAVFVSCGTSGTDSSGNLTTPWIGAGDPSLDEGPAPNPMDQTSITVSFPLPNACPEGSMCSALVTPGVPPGTIATYGTIENGQCYDPHNPACLVSRTAQVVGGNLNITYTVAVNTYLHIGYVLANQIRVDNISINGTPLTTFGALGTAPSQWPVACFRVNRDQAGVVTVSGNPACTAVIKREQLVVTGDTGGSGIGSYTNNAYNMPYDDTLVPYTGAQPGEDLRIQTSLWADPAPGGVWQQLVWDATMNAYTETFFSVLSTQSYYITIHHPSREPTCSGAVPPCDYVPGFGVYMNTLPVGGGAIQCTTQLVHYEDLDPGVTYWVGMLATGLNTTTNCVTQGADTRGVIVSGP